MGACEFLEIELGKSMGEAFDKAAEHGRWEHGHGGYSGTIAEKDGVVDCGKLPPRWTVNDFLRAIEAVRWEDSTEVHYPDTWVRTAEQKKQQAAVRSRQKKLAERIKRDVPERALQLLLTVTDDKWGPAAGIEVTGVDAQKRKDQYESTRGSSYQIDRFNREIPGTRKKSGPSTRGMKVYAFFGLASS